MPVISLEKKLLYVGIFGNYVKVEALENVMCDIIKIRLKRRIATRSGKGNQLLNIKTAVKRPILKLRLPNFWWSFYFILLLVASLLFRRIFMMSHMKLSSTSPGCFSSMLRFSQTDSKLDSYSSFTAVIQKNGWRLTPKPPYFLHNKVDNTHCKRK